MLIFEVVTAPKEGKFLQDDLIKEVVVLDTRTSKIHHLVNSTYLVKYVVGKDEATQEEIDLLTLSSALGTRELPVDDKVYQEVWKAIDWIDFPDELALIALEKETDTESATPLVAVDPLDLGILFTSLQITFTADGSLPFNEIFVKLLDNTLDFITITHVLKIDHKPIYDEARYVQARLITIEKILKNFKNIL